MAQQITGTVQKTPAGAPMVVGARRRDVDLLAEMLGRRLRFTFREETNDDRWRDWYWGIVQETADGIGVHKDDLHARLKYAAGLIKSYIPGDSGPVVVLKSTRKPINGGDLSASEYRKYVGDAIEIIFMRYVDKTERPELFKRVEARVGPRPR